MNNILVGHSLGNEVTAFAVFPNKPTKEELLQTNRFEDTVNDNLLIDILLEHNVCGVSKNSKAIFEYLLITPDENGNLNLNDYLFTGIVDMNPELCVEF